MASDLTLNLKLNATPFVQELNTASTAFKGFVEETGLSNMPLARREEIPLLTDNPNIANSHIYDVKQTESINKLVTSIYDLINFLKSERSSGNKFFDEGDDEEGSSGEKGKKKLKRILSGVGTAAGLTASVINGLNREELYDIKKAQSFANQDVLGYETSRIEQKYNRYSTAINIGSTILGGVVGFLASPMAGVAVATATKTITESLVAGNKNKDIADLQKQNAESEKYIEYTKSAQKSLVAYGALAEDVNDPKNSYNRDDRKNRIMDFYSKMSNYVTNTGLTFEEFNNKLNQFSYYGNTVTGTAGVITNSQLANIFYGMDSDLLTDLILKQAQYKEFDYNSEYKNYLEKQGIKEEIELDKYKNERKQRGAYASNYNPVELYNNAINTGLAPGEVNSYIQGLYESVTDGISKGFLRESSTTEDVMANFARLSGRNQFWNGTEGFAKYKTINSGIESATSLSSPTDLLVFQAYKSLAKKNPSYGLTDETFIQGADGLNALAAMEEGLTNESFEAIADYIDKYSGGDPYQKVMAWKQISKLNMHGAMQLANMADKRSTAEKLPDISSITGNVSYLTEEQKRTNLVNDIYKKTITFEESFKAILKKLKYMKVANTER